MSNQEKTLPEAVSESAPEPEESRGPSLALMYFLLALALLTALGIAAMIVWPFYVRR